MKDIQKNKHVDVSHVWIYSDIFWSRGKSKYVPNIDNYSDRTSYGVTFSLSSVSEIIDIGEKINEIVTMHVGGEVTMCVAYELDTSPKPVLMIAMTHIQKKISTGTSMCSVSVFTASVSSCHDKGNFVQQSDNHPNCPSYRSCIYFPSAVWEQLINFNTQSGDIGGLWPRKISI